jgi:hypothetical protein
MSETALVRTRHSLHAVAELILAGAQYAACERITLQVAQGGFSTRFEPALQVEGVELVGGFGRVTLDGLTVREAASAAGVELISLAEVYADGAAYGPDDSLAIDPASASELAASWQTGHDALRELDPTCEPILWPEHFDVGISLDEVNYGVSPGDTHLPIPYAYVGPWSPPTGDAFFNAPFGASRPLADLGGTAGVAAFFAEGRNRAGKL